MNEFHVPIGKTGMEKTFVARNEEKPRVSELPEPQKLLSDEQMNNLKCTK